MLNFNAPGDASQSGEDGMIARKTSIVGITKIRGPYSMKTKIIVVATFALATFALGGCATSPWGTGSASTGAEAEEIALQKAELVRKEADLARRSEELEAERRRLENALGEVQTASSRTESGSAGRSLIPPDPKPGECYARVIVDAQYRSVAERKLKKQKSQRIEVIPASYEEVSETVLVKEASTRLEVVPARYETVLEEVMVKPETIKLVPVPAEYETIEERKLVAPEVWKTRDFPAEYKTVKETEVIPEYTEWRRVSDQSARGRAALASSSRMAASDGDYEILETRVEDTGDLMCLVRIPEKVVTYDKQVVARPARTEKELVSEEVWETVTRTVVKTPATTREVRIPPEYRMVEVTKLVEPATTREIEIPAEYAEVKVTKLIKEAQERKFDIPAEYDVVNRREKIHDLREEWRSVLCKVNETPEIVMALQSALNEKNECQNRTSGDRCVVVDGHLGKRTVKAAQIFARDNGLSSGNNYVTMEVVRALGVKL